MLILDNIKFSISSLWSNRIRSVLTMLGVIIGVFAIITLISIGEGVRDEFASQVEGLGSNLVIVVPGQLDLDNTQEGGGFNPANFASSTLSEEDAQAIKDEVESIEKNAPMGIVSGVATRGDQMNPSAMILATTTDFFEIIEYTEIDQGRIFTQEEYNDKANIVIIGGVARENMFGEEEALGQTINFASEEFEIIGTLKVSEDPLEMGGTSFDNVILLPLTTGKKVNPEANINIIRIVNKVEDAEQVEQTVEKVQEVMLRQHNEQEDFSVLTMEDILNLFNSIFSILTQAITGIAAISLIVGGIGIMNIMLVSVTERTREIGIRKAIGATSLNILTQFLIEAAVISLLGGVIGVALSFVAGQLITQYADIPTQITWIAVVYAFAISVGVGITFGLMPAVKAARQSPIEALRYE